MESLTFAKKTTTGEKSAAGVSTTEFVTQVDKVDGKPINDALPSHPLQAMATDHGGAQQEHCIDKMSYWDQAVDQLRHDNPKVFEAFQEIRKALPNSSEEVVDEMFAAIDLSKKRMESRQWSLPWKVRGRTVNIRYQLDTILNAVKVFKDFGSTVASIDLMHAGIAWAGVNLIIQVRPEVTRYDTWHPCHKRILKYKVLARLRIAL
jgi:hypothetical protein